VICRPLEHGADLVLHSATKYIGGHSDATGGVVTGRIDLISAIRGVRVDMGGCLSPDEAFLLRRGLETLPLRVRRACATATVFAAALSRHPNVLRIDYPGLPGHAGHELARRQFDSGPEGTRFGAIVTVIPHGGREAGMAFADKLRLAAVATSLGGTHTKVSHVASTTHRQMDDRALAAGGIDPGAVRFSIGLEDAEDLISDAYVALESLGRSLVGRLPGRNWLGFRAEDPGRRRVRRPQYRTRDLLRERRSGAQRAGSGPLRGRAHRHHQGRAVGTDLG
jgi:cystathionine beta-lyase/cystathionine gamma-synthase